VPVLASPAIVSPELAEVVSFVVDPASSLLPQAARPKDSVSETAAIAPVRRRVLVMGVAFRLVHLVGRHG
jgi:hypothetical protein